MENLKIRRALKEAGMKQWQLAELLGVSESTMCVRLRRELLQEEQQKIISIIEENKRGVKTCHEC